jgi:hypothetical protein
MKILKQTHKQKFLQKIIYYNNIKKKNISKFNILFIKAGLI